MTIREGVTTTVVSDTTTVVRCAAWRSWLNSSGATRLQDEPSICLSACQGTSCTRARSLAGSMPIRIPPMRRSIIFLRLGHSSADVSVTCGFGRSTPRAPASRASVIFCAARARWRRSCLADWRRCVESGSRSSSVHSRRASTRLGATSTCCSSGRSTGIGSLGSAMPYRITSVAR